MPARPVILANAVALAPIGTAAESTYAIGDTIALSLQSTTGYTSFAWRLIGFPAGSAAALSSTSGYTSSLTIDVAGEYRIQGVATGSDGTSSARVSVIVVLTPNRALRKVDRAAIQTNVAAGLDDLVEKWNDALDTLDEQTTTAGLADLSVTTAKLAAGAVTNEKVDAAAAIAGTKVAPAFGAQTIEAGVTKAKSFCRTSSVSTTDATATVADTYTPPADCGVKVTASALGVQSDGSDAWEGSAMARFLVSGGVVTQIGTTTPGDEGGSAASTGCAVGIDTSGGAIRVLVTGISGQTWRWSAEGGFMIRTTGA